jgi:hypothetical protein
VLSSGSPGQVFTPDDLSYKYELGVWFMSGRLATGPISGQNYTTRGTTFTFFGQEGRNEDGFWSLPGADGSAESCAPLPILADIEAGLYKVIAEGKESLIGRICLSPVDGLCLALEGCLTVDMLQQSTENADSIGIWMQFTAGPVCFVVIYRRPPYEDTPVILDPNEHRL